MYTRKMMVIGGLKIIRITIVFIVQEFELELQFVSQLQLIAIIITMIVTVRKIHRHGS